MVMTSSFLAEQEPHNTLFPLNNFGHVRIWCWHWRKYREHCANIDREKVMDAAVFRRFCSGLRRLSIGQMRELRSRLGGLDARLVVLSQLDARGEAMRVCVPCGGAGSPQPRPAWRVFVATLGRDRNGFAAMALQDLRAKLFGNDGNRAFRYPPAREAPAGARGHDVGTPKLLPRAGTAARHR